MHILSLTLKRLPKKANPVRSFLSVPLSCLSHSLNQDSAQCRSKIIEDFPDFSMCVRVCVCLFLCLCVCDAFGDKDPCCRESCGKGVWPEDVSTLVSDNVSLRDTACHFTQPHIKKDRGGMEEKTACHLFALIQLTQQGIRSLWVCACMCVCVCLCLYVCMFVCPACEQMEFCFRDISELSSNKLHLKR